MSVSVHACKRMHRKAQHAIPCIAACTHRCSLARACAQVHSEHMHGCVYVEVHVCRNKHMCMRTYACCKRMHGCTHVQMYACAYKCMHPDAHAATAYALIQPNASVCRETTMLQIQARLHAHRDTCMWVHAPANACICREFMCGNVCARKSMHMRAHAHGCMHGYPYTRMFAHASK